MTPAYTPAIGLRGTIRWTRDALLAVASELLPQDQEFRYAEIEVAAKRATGAPCYGPGLAIALLRQGCIERVGRAPRQGRRDYVYRVVPLGTPWSEEDILEARRLMRLEPREVRR